MPPPPIPPELLTPAGMAQADAAALVAGISGDTLMQAAGRAVARAAIARFRPCRTLVLAGPGNNGGDGYVAARLLEQAGWPVALAALAPPRPGSDAAHAAARWHGPTTAFTPANAARAALVIDAVFGAGLTRDLDGIAAETLRAVQAPILAIDVPSGLDGATGAPRGLVRQATLTVTFFRLKPGHLLLPGRTLCGDTLLADIGLPATVLRGIRPDTFANGPSLWPLPDSTPETHKYRRGHVTILASGRMPGAARLAAAAARRAGAGLTTIAASPAAAGLLRQGDPGLLVTAAPLPELLADARRNAWLIGPGLPPDDATRAALASLLAAGRATVVDAGALTACAGAPDLLRGAAILTPHAQEFARLFGPPGTDRLAAARAAAAKTGAVVLLKGADSIIAAPDGRAAINHNAPPSLATAGTGDVLAGLCAALLAQGMPAFEAAAAAAWLHGEAASALPACGLIAEDLPGALPAALAAARDLQRR